MNAISSAAADYAARGFPVLPLKPGSKHPATRHGKNDATTDAGQVSSWFPPDTDRNVGIVTGEQSRLIVVDIDPRNDGDAGFDRLERTYGKLPDTLRAKTGGGGGHLYFRVPAGTDGLSDRPNVASYRGVDVKAGGYVVAAPSIHESGKAYAWESDTPIADAPDWLIDLARGDKRIKPAASPPSNVIAEGGRNSALCSLAGGLRAKGLGEEALRVALLAENEVRCNPPLDPEEVERIARSVARYAPESRHPESDVGNARRLVDALSGKARFDHASRAWFTFDGRYWRRDADGAIIREAKSVGDGLLAEAQAINDHDSRKRRIAFALKSQASTRVRAMVELAQSEPGIPVAADAFDRPAHLLNARNGTIDLRSGELLPHDAAHLLSRMIDIDYAPHATCPTWERFVSEVFQNDAELIEFAHRVIGYCATGETREQLFLILHGDGANGKSTLLKAISDALGPYASHTPTETLTVRNGGQSNDVARLMGARFVTASEADSHQRLNEGFIKQVTGDEPITARYLYGEFFTFQPVFKLALATNALPAVNGADPALFRRLRLIPFSRVFSAAEQDKGLGVKLASELPGILAWIVRGAAKWYANGLTTPAAVLHAGAEFRADSDTVGAYIEDRCELAVGEVIQASHLFGDYRRFTDNAGREPLNQTAFGRALTRRGIPAEKRGGSAYRVGIKLRSIAA
ncbi:phage/plasmid primase, P4 family [Sphingomonas lacusdianchii]|uniref:phage/plasmid primase, P4 family n=1 Tax=Sphingomonas lacusdianchii TaxID=2917992 RepID=UPI001F598749|nr:phage/plasmid primase, P4 family [Sphingomonas sp. JXJ CY 53]